MAQFGWPPRPIPNFKAALRDVRSRGVRFRRNAAVALGLAEQEQREEAIKGVEVLLEDEDAGVRLEAVMAAGKLRAMSLTGRIARILESKRPDERIAALDFLSQSGDESHWEAVRSLLQGEQDVQVRCMALETLSFLDPEKCRPLVVEALGAPGGLDTDYLRTLVMVLSEIGEPGDMDVLTPLLDHHSTGVRVETASALALMDRLEEEKKLTAILMDAVEMLRDRRLKELALEGLCKIGSRVIVARARQKFRSFFTRKQEKIYWAAICCGAGDGKAGDFLHGVYGGRSPVLASRVLWVAGLCGLREWIPVMEDNIRKSFGAGEDDFLYDSIHSLGKMHCPESIEALKRLEEELGGKHPEVAGQLGAEREVSQKILERRSSVHA
jgi:hypothetical protein